MILTACHKNDVVDKVLVSNANIVNVENGTILFSKDIWIENDHILKITPHNSKQKKSFITIDATGKYVIPGLWDMHTHIVDYDWVPKLYTALGITGIRIMHGGSLVDSIVANRKDGFFRGFEFLYAGPIVDGPGPNWPGTAIANNPEEGRRIVRLHHKKGYDFVKVYDKLDYDTYMAIADECKSLNFPFAGHVPMSVTTEQAIEVGQKSIEHSLGLELATTNPYCFNSKINDSTFKTRGEIISEFLHLYDSSLNSKFLAITSGKNTWFCPTMVSHRNLAYANDSLFRKDIRLKYIPKEEQDYWFGKDLEMPAYMESSKQYEEAEIDFYKLTLSSLKPMLQSGARFLAGTDTSNPNIYPGFSLHDELQLFVEAGFTELEALQTATINPAIYAGREKELGTIEEGKIANLVILEKNPLKNIKNTLSIIGVMRRGEYLNKEALIKLLDYNKN